MTLLLIAVTAAGAASCGPWLRSRIFAHSVSHGRPLRNRCPRCHTPLATGWFARLPVTGRCPLCRGRIGPAAATVELTGAAVTAVIASHSTHPITAVALLWVAWHGIILSYVDGAVHRLPDTLTARVFAGTATLLAISAATTPAWQQLLVAFGGAITLGSIYLIIVVARPNSLGLGDAKLAPTLGLILTWFHPAATISALIAIITVGILTAVILLTTKRIHRNQAFAHGPVMMSGALIAYVQIA